MTFIWIGIYILLAEMIESVFVKIHKLVKAECISASLTINLKNP